jgi:hypothetical protein
VPAGVFRCHRDTVHNGRHTTRGTSQRDGTTPNYARGVADWTGDGLATTADGCTYGAGEGGADAVPLPWVEKYQKKRISSPEA